MIRFPVATRRIKLTTDKDVDNGVSSSADFMCSAISYVLYSTRRVAEFLGNHFSDQVKVVWNYFVRSNGSEFCLCA